MTFEEFLILFIYIFIVVCILACFIVSANKLTKRPSFQNKSVKYEQKLKERLEKHHQRVQKHILRAEARHRKVVEKLKRKLL